TKQDIWLNTSVTDVSKIDDDLFEINYLKDGRNSSIITPKVVVCTGGLPVVKLGASDFALKVARKFGLNIVPTAPALVPLTITGKDADWYASLAGNSIFSEVFNDRIAFTENILFTH